MRRFVLFIILIIFPAGSAAAQQPERFSAHSYNKLADEFKRAWGIYARLLPAYNATADRHNALLALKNAVARDIIPDEAKYRVLLAKFNRDYLKVFVTKSDYLRGKGDIIPYIEGCFFHRRSMVVRSGNAEKTNAHVSAWVYRQLSIKLEKVSSEYAIMLADYREMRGNIARLPRDMRRYGELRAKMDAHFTTFGALGIR